MTTTERNPWAVYDAMEIPHLERFLDDGADFVGLDLTEEDVQGYASTAAVRWHGPPLVVRGDNAGDVMQDFFMEFVIKVTAIHGEDGRDFLTYHEDDRVTLEHSGLGTVEVTDRTMRHWQWNLMLFAREDVAARFLAAVPDRIRAAAMERATMSGDDAEFLAIVFGGAPGDEG